MARNQIFISYSHTDEVWKDRVVKHLKVLVHEGLYNVWDDRRISAGADWLAEIKTALAACNVALLLISVDFLNSPFILSNEVPDLLQRRQQEGVQVIPVILKPCAWTKVSWLKSIQSRPKDGKPLIGMSEHDVEATLTALTEEVADILATVARFDQLLPSLTVEQKQPVQQVSLPLIEPIPSIKPAHLTLPAIPYIHGWSAQQVQELQRQTASALGVNVEFRDTLKDGSQGPLMIVIPGGRFLMGSPTDELGRRNDERQHEVAVSPFAIGKYTVTFEDYDRFAGATGCERSSDEGWGRGRRPVINISWFDAVAYTQWLSEQTGQEYRLPTEAEWEYACRAGTTTPFYFGETINTDQANYDGTYTYSNGHKGVYRQKTMEVGQFPTNAWGLHDMHGNVWEWTYSNYNKNYDGDEKRLNSSTRSVLRGGSWYSDLYGIRGAARNWLLKPRASNDHRGFRLARTFP